MQNLASSPDPKIVPILTSTPPCDPGPTPVIPLYDRSHTPHIQAQTPVTPPAHTCLSCKQARVLGVLIENATRTSSYALIGATVGISKSAARSAVNQLVKKKYISVPETVRDGVFQGFSYWVDNAKCQQFLDAGGASNEKYLSSTNIITPPTHTVCPPYDPTHTHSSSFKLDSKLTTKTVNLDDPELSWWSEQGVTNKQIISWLDQFSMEPEYLAQALKFARFDIVENKIKPQGDLIAKPPSWFFTVLKKSGQYSRPANYKSVHEIRAEQLDIQKRLDDDAKKKIWEHEIEDKLKDIMADQESPLYQELLGCVEEYGRDDPLICGIQMKELLKAKYPMDQYRSKG